MKKERERIVVRASRAQVDVGFARIKGLSRAGRPLYV